MKSAKKVRRMLGLAVAVTLGGLVAGQTLGQYRVGDDGRALDANNRVGSGGLNEGGARMPYGYGALGNNIVTGNVTGGREFRGFVPYTDPRAFRGPTAGGLSDRFIRQSSGAPFGGVPNNNAQVVQPFYGDSRAVPPPPGFVEQAPGTSGYIPAPQITRQPNDLRLGQTLDIPTTALPQPGQLYLPGPVDPSTQTSSLITASPLYGVRQWDMSEQANQDFLRGDFAAGTTLLNGVRVDAAMLQQMRRELQQTLQQNLPQELEGQPGAEGAGEATRGFSLAQPMGQPMEAVQNPSLATSAAIRAQTGSVAISGDLRTGEGTRQRLLTARPSRISTQYSQLEERLKRYRAVQELGDQAASRQFVEDMRRKQQEQQGTAARPGGTAPAQGVAGSTPGAEPQTPAAPGIGPAAATPSQTPSPRRVEIPGSVTAPPSTPLPKPPQIKSLAEGVQAKGLADLLAEAEKQMKAGKYNSAIEQYDLADQVAPNNPWILLGRANAELGQSYYRRAEEHLRQAFTADQALLMGQYDLRTLLGNERLEFLVQDLKEIARNEPREPRPVFLLAYIAYNTGNERLAAAYLDLAEKRSNNDPFYQMVRKHWSLPQNTEGAVEELNK